jgi:signal transduction histidine kinase
MPAKVAPDARSVVRRSCRSRLIRRQQTRADLLPEDEAAVVAAQDDGAAGRRYVGAVRGIRAIVRRRGDLLLAVALTLVGELEILLGAGDGRLVRALALPVATLPLARRRDEPLLALLAVVASLLVQVLLGDYFDAGGPATTLVAMVIALYSAGRHIAGPRALVGAVTAAAILAATRIAFDPEVDDVGAAALTVMAVALPLLVGRWANGQERLHRELETTARRRERERERDARDAAEEERMRIAADLQAAVADRLGGVVEQAGRLRGRLAAGDAAPARELLASIAGSAREALADVRRVLGILRRDDGAPPLAPPTAAPAAAPPTAAPGVAPPSAAPGVAPPSAAPAASSRAATAAPPSDAAAPSLPAARERVSSRRRAAALPPAWLDRLLVAALVAGAQLELLLTAPSDDRAFAALTGLLMPIPLLWRRRHPIPAALAVLAVVGLQSAVLQLDSFPVSDVAALVCSTYAIGAFAPRRHAIAGLALFALADAAHAAAFYSAAVPIALFGGALVPWTAGRIVRGQRQLVSEAHEQAIQVERARERDARAAVIAERMRVARELHDAVAHNISVIAIQAAGADGVLERDPDRAAECGALIEEVGREAVAELRRLTGAAPASPPSLARVDALAQRTRDGGLPVDLRVEGDPGRLGAGVDLAAFRIVQEALANASKHAGAAHAWVVVRYDQRAVEVEIGDDGRGPTAPTNGHGAGHGLVGMRERVALYGGTLDVGRRPGGGFAVRARLPLGGT